LGWNLGYCGVAYVVSLPTLHLLSLSFQDVAGLVENQLASPSLEPHKAQGEAAAAGPGEPTLTLPPSSAVWKGLQRCLEADVFLPQVWSCAPASLACRGSVSNL